jgi:hypothetical protein
VKRLDGRTAIIGNDILRVLPNLSAWPDNPSTNFMKNANLALQLPCS